MDINWASAYEAGEAAKTAAAAGPAATSAPTVPTSAPAPATSSSETTTNTETDLSELFDGLIGVANSLTSFGGDCGCVSGTAGDYYIGQVGSPYGSNIIKVDSTEGYAFTNTFHNTQSETITVNVWNKVGHDMQPLSGSALAPKSTTLTFTLAPGKSQVVAFMADSQVGWAQATSATAESGAYATSWGEANFCTSGSGYDLSAIMNANGNNYNMSISSLEAPACTSDMNQNMWLTPTEPVGGSDGSCYIAQNTATLTTIMGGTV